MAAKVFAKVFVFFFSFYATLQRNVTSGIYHYITTEFDYAKRDSRLAAYGGAVLQRFEFVAYVRIYANTTYISVPIRRWLETKLKKSTWDERRT